MQQRNTAVKISSLLQSSKTSLPKKKNILPADENCSFPKEKDLCLCEEAEQQNRTGGQSLRQNKEIK